MKSFFIADILGETSTKEKTIESCDECNTQSEKEGNFESDILKYLNLFKSLQNLSHIFYEIGKF